MSVMFIVFTIFGYLCSFYLKKSKKKRDELEEVDPRKDQNKTFRAFDELVTDFNTSFDSKLNELQDYHSLQREMLAKDRHGLSAIDHHSKHGDSRKWRKNNNLMLRPALKALHMNVVVPVMVAPSNGDNFSPHKDNTTVELFQRESNEENNVDQIDSDQQTSFNNNQTPPPFVEDIGNGNSKVVLSSPESTPRMKDDAGDKNENDRLEEAPIEEFEEVLQL